MSEWRGKWAAAPTEEEDEGLARLIGWPGWKRLKLKAARVNVKYIAIANDWYLQRG